MHILDMIITVANQKGGVGKSSAAAILVKAIAADGSKVLAVDCDHPQGGLTRFLAPDFAGREVIWKR